MKTPITSCLMEEDTAPRLTPPPKPAVLQLSTPKHAVPEVSLMYDSESSLTWQLSHHNIATTTTTTTHQLYTTTNTTRAEPTSKFSCSTTRWPLPQPTQDFLRHAPRAVKGVNQISPLAAPRLTGAQRFTLEHKAAQNIPSFYASPPIHPEKEYNPQLYSPLAKHSSQSTIETQAGPERNSPAGGQVAPNRVRFSLAGSVPKLSGVPQGPHVGTVSSAGKDVRQDALNTHTGSLSLALTDVQQNSSGTFRTMPSAVRGMRQNAVGNPPGLVPSADSVRQEKAVEGIQGTTRPSIIPQASNISQNNTYKPSCPAGGDVGGYTRLQTISSTPSTAPSHTHRAAVPKPCLVSTSTTGTTANPLAPSIAPPGSIYRAAVPAPPLVRASSTTRTTTDSPASTTAPSQSYRPALPPLSTVARTTTYPRPSNTVLNDAFTDHSSPYLPQARSEMQPDAYNCTDWSSPVSTSFQTPPTNPYIPQGPEYMGKAWGYHPEHHYSPSLPMAGLPHSPADPVVYGLIEDQKRQILKLTKDLQKIMKRQAKEEEEEEGRMPRGTRRGRSSQKHDHCDVTTQTQEKPAMITVGVNTDVSWPDLIASLRYQEEKQEVTDTTDPHYSDQDRNEWLRDIKMSRDHIPSHQHFTHQRNSAESASEITDDSHGGSESSSGQEWVQQQQQVRPTPTLTPPNITTGHARGDTGAGWQRTQTPRDHGNTPHGASPSSSSPPPPPAGTTFYHNVLTNIQQILQHTSPSQEEQQQQQQQQQQHQQQQQPFTPSQGVVVRAGTGESSGGGGGSGSSSGGPDPQIEAVRRQLLNFGISFLDPATLTPSHRPLVDSLYLPGLHNTISLYQTSLTTTTAHLHHHPSDATAAKYLTDSQLAAIAAASPAMKNHSDQAGNPVLPSSGLPAAHHHHLYRLHPNSDDNNNNSVSMATRKFLEKYGLQED